MFGTNINQYKKTMARSSVLTGNQSGTSTAYWSERPPDAVEIRSIPVGESVALFYNKYIPGAGINVNKYALSVLLYNIKHLLFLLLERDVAPW